MMRCSERARRAISFIQAMVRMISKVGGRASGRRAGGGTLAIEMHQVGQQGLRAELAKQGGNLPAMVSPVIH